MRSPLGSTMANALLSFYEVEWLEQYPKEFKPIFYDNIYIYMLRYVDDILVLFELVEHLSKFRDYFNNRIAVDAILLIMVRRGDT